MAKILLVEDDDNLREIYGARLDAEGYDVLSSRDGEEALAVAVKEKPDLIISDIMMPRISGFDMIDILRQTPETQDIKIIVMTALSQEEDKKRGESLGADSYLVKSQVTLEDVVNLVEQTLAGSTQTNDNPATAPTSNSTDSNDPASSDDSTADQPLAQEVQDFVTNSPLMNGTAPQPTKDATKPDQS